ncbi:MAG TPA: hypothetical protein VMV27_06210 [Candidatus Binataceae bacterium]|nr:hypothetical protein [Candidatus Binataceae bacterium]
MAQAQDTHAPKSSEPEHRAVTGNNRIGETRDRAFEDPVVRIILERFEAPPRLDRHAQLAEEYGDTRQLVHVTSELARQYAQAFIDNRMRDDQSVAARHHTAKGLVGAAARKHERGNEDVGVEDDLHSRRYRSRSCSVKIPWSRALRLQKP